MSTNDTILVGTDGLLYRLPTALAKQHQLDRGEVLALIKSLTVGRDGDPEVAKLLQALDGAEVEAQGFDAPIALLIAALFAAAPSAADAQSRPERPNAAAHVGQVAPQSPEAASIGQPFALHGRTLRVRNVEAVAHYRDQGGVTRHAGAGNVFLRVRYDERNDDSPGGLSTTLAQANHGDRESVRAAASEFPLDGGIELARNETRTINTIFEVPRSWLGKTVVLIFYGCRVDPLDASDTVGARGMREHGDASRAVVEVPQHAAP